jgi:hypothetical protein
MWTISEKPKSCKVAVLVLLAALAALALFVCRAPATTSSTEAVIESEKRTATDTEHAIRDLERKLDKVWEVGEQQAAKIRLEYQKEKASLMESYGAILTPQEIDALPVTESLAREALQRLVQIQRDTEANVVSLLTKHAAGTRRVFSLEERKK